MNPIAATKLFNNEMEASAKKFEYLIKLGDLYGNFEITKMSMETDFYSKKAGDYFHTQHDGPLQPMNDPNVDVIPLSTKTISFEVNEQTISISVVEYLEKNNKVAKVTLVDGYRTTFDNYEGIICGTNEVSSILGISKSVANSFLQFLFFHFQAYSTLFQEQDNALIALFKNTSEKEG